MGDAVLGRLQPRSLADGHERALTRSHREQWQSFEAMCLFRTGDRLRRVPVTRRKLGRAASPIR